MGAIYGGYGNIRITRPSTQSPNGSRLVIYTDNESTVFYAPFAPRSVDYSGYEAVYNTTDRPDRKPLLTRAGYTLRKMSMELLIMAKDVKTADGLIKRTSQDSRLKKLEDLASSVNPLIVEYDPRTYGRWRISALSFSSVERDAESDEIVAATANIEFTEIAGETEFTLNNNDRPKKVVVKQGDSLSDIASAYYGTTSIFIVKAIAKANGMTNPRNVPKTLRLP